MIRIGSLVRHKHNKDKIAQVIGLWTKRDIDYECPESVAIIGMVRLIYIHESSLGHEGSVSRRAFSANWEVLDDTTNSDNTNTSRSK